MAMIQAPELGALDDLKRALSHLEMSEKKSSSRRPSIEAVSRRWTPGGAGDEDSRSKEEAKDGSKK